ncbi:MAG: ATP-binding protein [Coriobacteriia bacterium]|nr:ATP-binding protein [Coriobacteriia bacterium]
MATNVNSKQGSAPQRLRSRRMEVVTVAVIVLMALLVVGATLFFGDVSRRAANDASSEVGRFYLEEITDRTVREIDTQLDTAANYLQHAADELGPGHLSSRESLREYLALVQRLNGFDMLAVMDEDGKVWTADETFDGASRYQFLMGPVSERTIYTTKTSRSRAAVVIVVPTERLAFGKTHVVNFLASVDVDEVVTAQQIQGESNQVLCRLFDGIDGTCLVDAEGRYADGSSIFDIWRNDCQFPEEYPVELVISDWQRQQPGYVEYQAGEGVTYLCYKPVPNTNWMVSARIRHNVLGAQMAQSSNVIFSSNVALLVVVIVCMLLVSGFTIRQVRRLQMERLQREKEEELLRQEALMSAEKLQLQEQLLQEEVALYRQASVVQVLSREYASVFFVDLQDGIATPIRVSDFARSRMGIDSDRTYDFAHIMDSFLRPFVVPEELDQMLEFVDLENLREELLGERTAFRLYKAVREGRELYMQLRIAQVEGEGDARHAVVGFAEVDEQVRAEQQKQRTLEDALAAAERASQAKTAFLNNMSHDIRTPMNAIVGFATLAAEHSDEPERVRDYLGKIRTASEHLMSLINDVLDMSRIESGKVVLEEQPLHLPDLVRDLSAMVQTDMSARKLEFVLDVDELRDPDVVADKLRVEQVMLNLLSNAMKFTEPGGTVTLGLRQLEGAPAGCAAFRFSVEDTGIGIGAEFQEHIFEQFTRERTSTVSGIQGTGLGMAITKRIVDMMDGTIAVESQVGEGTTFAVTLQFPVAARSVDVAAEDGHARDFAGVRLLLVEDNLLNQEIALEILRGAGFEVDVVSDGTEAVAAMEEAPSDRYAMVLMDVQMPRMDGYEATRRIRALPDPVKSRIPVAAMTANAFAEDRQKALEAGMSCHVAKPIRVDDLLSTLAEFVG